MRRGSQHKATLAAQTLLDGEAEALTRKAVNLALDGDTVALRLCLERLVPPRRDAPVVAEIPEVQTSADLPAAVEAIVRRVATGELTPREGEKLASLLEAWRKAFELSEIEARIQRLEEGLPKTT